MRQKCLVLGGGGFIGSNLVEDLLNTGFDVRVFDVKNFSKDNLVEFLDRIEITEGDFTNPIDIETAINGVDYVYHLISTTLPANSVLNPTYDIESNLIPTLKLLQICLENKIRKVVFVSSGGTIYGIPKSLPIQESHPSNPLNSYGIIKRTIESYFMLYQKLWGLDVCIFRLSNPYGEKQNPKATQGAISVFLHKAINKEEIEIWGNGEVIRDYIYIKDATRILTESINQETPEIIYNLGSGIGISLNDLLMVIKSTVSPDLKVKYLPSRNFDVPVNILDIDLLKERFKVKKLVTLEIGIQKLHSYFLSKIK